MAEAGTPRHTDLGGGAFGHLAQATPGNEGAGRLEKASFIEFFFARTRQLTTPGRL